MDNNRTIVIGPRYIGNNILAHPLIQKLYADGKRPIDYLTHSFSSDVAKLMPEVDKIHIHDFISGKIEFAKRKQIGIGLQQFNYQYAYLVPTHFKPALVPYFANIPNIIGYKGEFRSFLLTEAKKPPSSKIPFIEKINALGFEDNETIFQNYPKLAVSSKMIIDTNCKYNLYFNNNTIVIGHGSGKSREKIWSSNNYSELIKLLRNQNYKFILLGTQSDSIYSHEILQSSNTKDVYDLTGKTSIVEAAAIIKQSFATISNDNGLMHLSAALGKNTLGIFTRTDPKLWKPQGPRADYISHYESDLSVNSVHCKFLKLIEK